VTGAHAVPSGRRSFDEQAASGDVKGRLEITDDFRLELPGTIAVLLDWRENGGNIGRPAGDACTLSPVVGV
jgi:hypothetical protein